MKVDQAQAELIEIGKLKRKDIRIVAEGRKKPTNASALVNGISWTCREDAIQNSAIFIALIQPLDSAPNAGDTIFIFGAVACAPFLSGQGL
jgi:hypothetical protein